jgi:hypothetical protein
VLKITDPIIEGSRIDNMICGNAPIANGQPQKPPFPILFFIFDVDRVTSMQARIENNHGQLQLFKFNGVAGWNFLVWTGPPFP